MRHPLGLITTCAAILCLSLGSVAEAPPAHAAVDTGSSSETVEPSTAALSGGALFIENAGQWDDGARFQVWGSGPGTTWLAEDAQWITVVEPAEEISEIDRLESMADPTRVAAMDTERAAVNLRLSFVDANPAPVMEPFGPVDTSVSYFIGADPDAWQTGVPVWSGVRYVDLYPGLDLEVTAENGQVVRRLVAKDDTGVQSLADVRLHIEGAEGLAADGAVVQAATPLGDVTVPLLEMARADSESGIATLDEVQVGAPEVDGDVVVAPFAAAESAVAEEAAVQDRPSDLRYGTFLGGSAGNEGGWGITVDESGAAYVTGYTESVDFPAMLGPGYATHFGGNWDTFVSKLSNNGLYLSYITFLGGNGYDYGSYITVDSDGAAYISGYTESTGFPAILGPGYDTSYNGNGDAYVIKLASDGQSLIYATYLGGSGADYGFGITVDTGGAAYIVGYTGSIDLPATTGPGFDASYNGNGDTYVVKLAVDGRSLIYATYLGGSDDDWGRRIAVDQNGGAYVAGDTASADFPAAFGLGYDTNLDGNKRDAYVVKLAADGRSLAYATFLGGADDDYGMGLALDGSGAAYISGYTYSPDFPTVAGSGFDTSYGMNGDAYVAKLATNGRSLVFATFLGGSEYDCSYSISVDGHDKALVTGYTGSADFPAAGGPGYDTSHNGGEYDAYVVELTQDGNLLTYASFLGGNDREEGWGIAVDRSGLAYVAGCTSSVDFPAASSPGYDNSFNGGGGDAFVVKLAIPSSPTYGVAGQVKDVGGHGVSGVTVSTLGGYSTVTGSDGSYTLSNMPAGICTVSTASSGYSFTPSRQTVAVTGEMMNVDFVAQEGGDPPEPFFDLPVSYDGSLFGFLSVTQNWNAGGLIKSWFDHEIPNTSSVGAYSGTLTYRGYPALSEKKDGYYYDGHDGYDIAYADAKDLSVRAAAPGTVIKMGTGCGVGYIGCTCNGGYGNWVLLSHSVDDQVEYYTRYAHLQSVNPIVVTGTIVTQGQVLGTMGSSGNSGGTHLHFETYRDGGNHRWDGESATSEDKQVDPFGWDGSTTDPWVLAGGWVLRQLCRCGRPGHRVHDLGGGSLYPGRSPGDLGCERRHRHSCWVVPTWRYPVHVGGERVG